MRYSFGGIILVTIGVLMLLDNLDYLDFGYVVSTYWPLMLVLWGFLILRRRNQNKSEEQVFAQRDTQQSVANELIHESNVFGDVFLNISSRNFKGGSISTTFGDSDVDLSTSIIAAGDHILRVQGVFGNCRIILPKDAPVAVSASTTFGKLNILGQMKDGISSGIDTATSTYRERSSGLKIIASTVFGNVVIS